MKYFDQTWPDPAANLAADEALLELCEAGKFDAVLRFWEPTTYFVVVGYANRAAREVNLDACARDGIPVFRRCSGGGTVLQGPGCLNYSLILRIPETGASPLTSISSTNHHIMERNRAALESVLSEPVEILGHTDLAIGKLKFSGNSQRRARRALLFHGSFLLNFDLAKISELLPLPSQQPCYRQNRPHSEFLTNLGLIAEQVKSALQAAWGAFDEFREIPEARICELAAEKYSQVSWNLRF